MLVVVCKSSFIAVCMQHLMCVSSALLRLCRLDLLSIATPLNGRRRVLPSGPRVYAACSHARSLALHASSLL
jgi:hypothetical protein